MKSHVFTFAVFLGLTACSNSQAVLERIKYNNPGLVVDLGVGLWAWPLPMDYDNDGDYDMVVCCPDKPYNGTYFFENAAGNVTMPVFKPAVKIGTGHRNIRPSYVDGRVRLSLPGREVAGFNDPKTQLKQTQVIYRSTNVHDSKGRIRANQWQYCDYDCDGELDLIVGVGDWEDYGWDNAFDAQGRWTRGPLHGYAYLILNAGTTENPKYAEPQKILAWITMDPNVSGSRGRIWGRLLKSADQINSATPIKTAPSPIVTITILITG